MSEPLVTCLFCGRRGFTARGLRAHWCPAKPPTKGQKKHSAMLTHSEWQLCVNEARKGPKP